MLAKIDTGKLGSFLIVLSVLFISVFGPGVIMGAAQNGDMVGCPLTGEPASVCQMGVVEHLSYWQQLFIAKINDANTLILWLLAILLLLVVYQLGIRNKDRRASLDLSFYLYNKSNPQTRLFNYLILAFSKGILHPKIY